MGDFPSASDSDFGTVISMYADGLTRIPREPEALPNFAADILGVAAGEPIIGVTIGSDSGWSRRRIDERRKVPARFGVLLSWGEAQPMLDYEYDTGYGGVDCDPVYAWTPTRVLFVSQYDGATRVEAIPREPVGLEAEMPGG